MSPEHIKEKVTGAWRTATRAPWTDPEFGFEDVVRNVALYGREAGVDFAETHLDYIVQEATIAAGHRFGEMHTRFDNFGEAALAGVADTLRQRTGLIVDVKGPVLTLRWHGDEVGPP